MELSDILIKVKKFYSAYSRNYYESLMNDVTNKLSGIFDMYEWYTDENFFKIIDSDSNCLDDYFISKTNEIRLVYVSDNTSYEGLVLSINKEYLLDAMFNFKNKDLITECYKCYCETNCYVSAYTPLIFEILRIYEEKESVDNISLITYFKNIKIVSFYKSFVDYVLDTFESKWGKNFYVGYSKEDSIQKVLPIVKVEFANLKETGTNEDTNINFINKKYIQPILCITTDFVHEKNKFLHLGELEKIDSNKYDIIFTTDTRYFSASYLNIFRDILLLNSHNQYMSMLDIFNDSKRNYCAKELRPAHNLEKLYRSNLLNWQEMTEDEDK